jgi:hypothetical protein
VKALWEKTEKLKWEIKGISLRAGLNLAVLLQV